MTDKDRPTRIFARNVPCEVLTAEGKRFEPPVFYLVFYDREEGDYRLWVFSEGESETEEKIAAFGGLVDRTFDRDVFDPCPIAFVREKKKAAQALKDGKLREFIEDAVKNEYDRWNDDLRPEIRKILIDFSLAYWRRELFDYYGKVDVENNRDPARKEDRETRLDTAAEKE